jgi:hypothetical protein
MISSQYEISMALASFDYDGDNLADALEFLKRTRSELRELRMVRVWSDRVEVLDINHDAFEILGIGYSEPAVCEVLDAVNTAYKRETLHEPTDEAYKEFKTGRRYPWAHDRVM